MAETKKSRRFYLPFLIAGVLAGLIFILPYLPQSGLRQRLITEFTQVLQQPCQIQKVNLQVFPRPAIVAHGFISAVTESSLEVRTLALDFSLASLITLTPRIIGARLHGALIEVPFPNMTGHVAGAVAGGGVKKSRPGTLSFFSRAIRAQGTQLKYIILRDAVSKLTKTPGLNDSLIITDIAGSWRYSAQNVSEQLNLSGALYGGRGGFKITWYQVEKPMLAGAEKSPDKAGERLEISCTIDDVSLPNDAIKFLSDPGKSLRAGFTKAHLDFDVNGDPEAGLRFTTNFAAVDHTFSIYDINLDSEKNCSRGAVKASLAGFSQLRDGYVNIKSASLEYPDAATLFYRGLVRFNEPLFVDLVSELKVADLNLLARSIPHLTLPGYQVKGELAGQLKLIGNPNSAPVLQVELKSDQITLQETELSRPLSAVSPAVTTGSLFSGFNNQFVNFCKLVAKWEWLVKSDCRVGALQLPDMTISDLSLLAEKNLVQVEVERLAARFGESGELRLSLILEDLLHEPRWQASLIAEKLDLKPFTKTLRFNGILDASLVGGGLLESDSEFAGGLGLNGKWHLRQGAFVGHPLYQTFTRFLKEKKRASFGPRFSAFSGKFALQDKILRLDNLSLHSGGSRVNAGGRFFSDNKRLKFHGQLIPKTSPPFSFSLSGDSKNPEFKLSGR